MSARERMTRRVISQAEFVRPLEDDLGHANRPQPAGSAIFPALPLVLALHKTLRAAISIEPPRRPACSARVAGPLRALRVEPARPVAPDVGVAPDDSAGTTCRLAQLLRDHEPDAVLVLDRPAVQLRRREQPRLRRAHNHEVVDRLRNRQQAHALHVAFARDHQVQHHQVL